MRTFREHLVESTNIDGFFNDLLQHGYVNPFNDREIVVNNEAGVEAYRINDTTVRLSAVRAFERRTGAGTRTMQLICQLADKYRLTLEGTATPFGGAQSRLGRTTKAPGAMNKSQLMKWYATFGFAVSKNGNMVRTPR